MHMPIGLKINMLTRCALLSLSVSMGMGMAMAMPSPKLNVYDVTRYGIIDNERIDIGQALSKAWKKACAMETGINKVLIPKGKYMLGMVELTGPCKTDMRLEIKGTLKAPIDLDGDRWISFKGIDRFKIFGHGTLDGQGSLAWKKNNCAKDPNCDPLPISVRFNSVNNSIIQDVTSVNSKNFNFNLLNCHNMLFNQITVIAPESSINTDGIHVGRSSEIRIMNSKIGTGDDCISIGDGTRNLNITGVICGPGHGISIGSLGRYENEQPVTGIYVSKCKISNTDQGIRIKTWAALQPNVASNLHFEDIVMDNVSIPILIDQLYCPSGECNNKGASKVKINDVSFKNIRGTSSSPTGVKLQCSSGLPCQNVDLININIKYNGNQAPAKIEYTNVKPKFIGTHHPPTKPIPIRMLMFQQTT
ncbi:exopolygalacturonase-like [Euphorbia lathyris]|uniref:exopolygalacturonase-like n=1 Tax=Euphorbia lathyris TaxID=212925 RepID=UPI003313FCC7